MKAKLLASPADRNRRGKRRSIATVGADRLRLLAYEMGDDEDFAHGWRTRVALRLGLKPHNLQRILRAFQKGDKDVRIGRATIDQVCAATGCPVGALLDDDA